ncbi:MAG: relaxase/mobilization nuclease domain-containing protein [Bacilli bacterium]|nr:relaxase/mobilization nuclease domain-containing protein [Bacilli bacterium]
MATTGIWKIEKRLDHVIDYVSNPEKTTKANESYQELHQFSEYDNLNFNTEEGCYVSGINCLPDDAYQDMMDTKAIWKKKDGVLGYHAFQSFVEGEVTADKAHLIGMKLAEEMWGDRFEVIVTTHINTNHIHNHFVINSVSFKDGKKFNNCNENYALLRHLSDSLCQEYGLSVLDNKKIKVNKVNYENFYQRYVKKNTYHSIAKQDLDRAIGMAYSYKDFENIMIKMGYEIKNRYGKLSINRQPYKKNIRIERAFGSDYSIESIEKRIELETATRVPFIEAYNPANQKKTFEEHKKEKAHGIYGLYKYYCYILGVYTKDYPNKILTPAMRVEVKKLDQISKQTQLLVNHKIETYQQLLFYKDTINQDIKELSSKRENLWRKIKRTKDDNEKILIRQEIDTLTRLLEPKRKEVVLCEGIEKRLGVVKENIKEFEEEKEKGEMKR